MYFSMLFRYFKKGNEPIELFFVFKVILYK